MPDTQPSASVLSDEALGRQFRDYFGHITPEEACRTINELHAKLKVTLPAPVSEPIAWARRRKDGKLSAWLFDSEESASKFGSDKYKAIPVFDKPQAVVAQPVDQRFEFEKWLVTSDGNCAKAYGHLERHLDGDYKLPAVERDWLVWQAARYPQAVVEQPVDLTEVIHLARQRWQHQWTYTVEEVIARFQSPQAKAGDKHD